MSEYIDPSEQEVLDLSDVLTPETVAANTAVSAEKAAKTPKQRTPRQPEGPNPYGIHNDRGEVITMSYLRKYFQCSCRGETYSRDRAANLAYFMSPEFLTLHQGESAGSVGRVAANDDRWFDETHARPVKKGRIPKALSAEGETPAKPGKGKKAKAAKQAANAENVTAAAADEAVIIDAGTVVNF